MRYSKINYPSVEENRYIVTENGDVYNIITGRWLKSSIDSHGYLVIPLKTDSGKYKNHYIARLVAWEFCERPEGMDIVNHINENPLNNHYSNLEWTDYEGNRKHSIKTGSIDLNGDNSPTSSYKRELIVEICEQLQDGATVIELVRKYQDVYGERAMKNLIGRIRRKECWRNVVTEYDFTKSFERTTRPAELYDTGLITNMVNEGMSNKEIMRYFGFVNTQSTKEEATLYDKIRRIRKKEKRSTTIPLALSEQQE